jgi:hypothetical protein
MSNIPDVNDGQWHRHAGGPKPVMVHELSTVEGYWPTMALTSEHSAISIDWADVFAYRVTKAHVEPPKPREWWLHPDYSVVLASRPACSSRYIHVREVLE